MFSQVNTLKLSFFAVIGICYSSVVFATTEIKLAFTQSTNHPQYLALEEFGKKVSTQTQGRYKIEIFQDALLGDQKTTIDLVRHNTIQMAVVAAPLLEHYNQTFKILSLPFIYANLEEQKKVLTSKILDALFMSPRKDGFEVLTAYTAGARSVYNNVGPVRKVQDLGGQKIRVMQSDIMVKMAGCLGSNGVPMGQDQVYSAIKQGIIDGAENNEITYADLKHYEVAPYYSTTRHLMVPDLLIVSSQFWEGISPEDRQIIHKLAQESTIAEFDSWSKQIDSAKKIAQNHGATFTEIDNAPFQESCKPLQQSILKTPEEKSLYNAIQTLK